MSFTTANATVIKIATIPTLQKFRSSISHCDFELLEYIQIELENLIILQKASDEETYIPSPKRKRRIKIINKQTPDIHKHHRKSRKSKSKKSKKTVKEESETEKTPQYQWSIIDSTPNINQLLIKDIDISQIDLHSLESSLHHKRHKKKHKHRKKKHRSKHRSKHHSDMSDISISEIIQSPIVSDFIENEYELEISKTPTVSDLYAIQSEINLEIEIEKKRIDRKTKYLQQTLENMSTHVLDKFTETQTLCICHKIYDETQQMINCDYCQTWYHLTCIGLDEETVRKFKDSHKFKCHVCKEIPLEMNINSMFNSPKTDDKYVKLVNILQTTLKSMITENEKYEKKIRNAKYDCNHEFHKRLKIQKKVKHMNEEIQKYSKTISDVNRKNTEFEEKLQNMNRSALEITTDLKMYKIENNTLHTRILEKENKIKLLRKTIKDTELNLETSNNLNTSLSHNFQTMNLQFRNEFTQKTNELQVNFQKQYENQFTLNLEQAKEKQKKELYTVFDRELNRKQLMIHQINNKFDQLLVQTNNKCSQWKNILFNNMNNNTLKAPSPIRVPHTPAYLVFNELEIAELEMCRELCLKLIDSKLYSIEEMAKRAHCQSSLFHSWMNNGSNAIVINDLQTNMRMNMNSIPINCSAREKGMHLSMNNIRVLLIQIRKTLEHSKNTDVDHLKVNELLDHFQIASDSYAAKMNDFEKKERQFLFQGIAVGTAVEILVSDGSQSRWEKAYVLTCDSGTGKILVRRVDTSNTQYLTYDYHLIRLLDQPSHSVSLSETNIHTLGHNKLITGMLPLTSEMLFSDEMYHGFQFSENVPVIVPPSIPTFNSHAMSRAYSNIPRFITNGSVEKESESEDESLSEMNEKNEISGDSSESSTESKKKKKAKKRKKKKSKKRKRKRKKKRSKSRVVDKSYEMNGKKRRKLNKVDGDFIVLPKSKSVVVSDMNDHMCRICKHPGNLVCCEGCPASYHAICVRPRIEKMWLDSFEEWFCPSCSPMHFYVPLKNKKSGEKWGFGKEPLLQNLEVFLERHPYLERDLKPNFHPKRSKNVKNS